MSVHDQDENVVPKQLVTMLLLLRCFRVVFTGERESNFATFRHAFCGDPHFVLSLHCQNDLVKERDKSYPSEAHKGESPGLAVSTCLHADSHRSYSASYTPYTR